MKFFIAGVGSFMLLAGMTQAGVPQSVLSFVPTAVFATDHSYACVEDLHAAFYDTYTDTRDVVYIVTGDSTRKNNYNEMEEYYTSQLAKIGMDIYYNAESGLNATQWLEGTKFTKIDQAIAHSRGDNGRDTILEFSLGLNEYDGRPITEVKQSIKTAIEAYIAAKSEAIVFLAIPVMTGNASRNIELTNAYREIAEELNLMIVDTFAATQGVHPSVVGNGDWYHDPTHPNKFGSRRIANFIIDSIVPEDLLAYIDIPPYEPLVTLIDDGYTYASESDTHIVPEVGYWSSSNGSAVPNDAWRRLPEIAVEGGTELFFRHQGNRRDVKFVDSVGNLVGNANARNISNGYQVVDVPVGATTARINVSSDGASYDALDDAPIITHDAPADTSVEIGYWSSSDGSAVPNDAWRRLPEALVEPGWILRITHAGNRVDVKFVDAQDNLIASVNTHAVAGEAYRTVVAPVGAAVARVNVSSDGASYDELGDKPSIEVEGLLLADVEKGYWSSSNGSAVLNDAWRRLAEIVVESGGELKVRHAGNRVDVKFVDAQDNLIASINMSNPDAAGYRSVVVPEGAVTARVNVSSDGVSYDALDDTPVVDYEAPPADDFMSVAEMNQGLDLKAFGGNMPSVGEIEPVVWCNV